MAAGTWRLAPGLIACALACALPAATQATDAAGAATATALPRGTWAHALRAATVRRSPETGSRAVGRLHFLTEDGQAEVYAISATATVAGRKWLRVSVPRRPRAVTGWVSADALGRVRRASTRLVVDRQKLVATLYKGGRRVMRAPIGVGRPSLPTPAGRFYVREKLRAIGGPVYGPFAIGTSAYSTLSDWPGGGVVGIHGTNEPGLIPGRPSHGCIRLRNADITRLWRRISLGTPIEIT